MNGEVQYPHELTSYCLLCVSSHFCPFTKASFVLENLNKNLGLSQTPAFLFGTKYQTLRKKRWEGSPEDEEVTEGATDWGVGAGIIRLVAGTHSPTLSRPAG